MSDDDDREAVAVYALVIVDYGDTDYGTSREMLVNLIRADDRDDPILGRERERVLAVLDRCAAVGFETFLDGDPHEREEVPHLVWSAPLVEDT